MPFREYTIYFVANEKLRKELAKDPVLSYNLYWIKKGTLKNAKLPKKGLFAIRNIVNPAYNEGAYHIPWDAIWSKKRQKVHFYLDKPKFKNYPPVRMLERIQELVQKCKTKAFYYMCEMHGGSLELEYAWIFTKNHTTILDEDRADRIAYRNGEKITLKRDVLYTALTEIGVKTKTKSGWFEPHTKPFEWHAIRLSPKISRRVEMPAFPTSLHRSAALGDIESVKKCLKANISPLKYTELLEVASKSGNTQLVQLFLKYKLEINNRWNGPLNNAQNKGTIKLLLEHGAQINHASNPLAYIAESGNEKAVKYMLKRGAKLQLCKAHKLWLGACKGGILFLVKLLYSKVDCNSKDIWHSGITLAAANNHLDVVKWLFSKGVQLDQNLLIEPAKNGHLKVVKWVLKKTPLTINGRNKYDDTALYEATYQHQLEMVDYLLSKGADPNQGTVRSNFCPIHGAAFSDSLAVLKRLLKAGVPIDTATNDQRTALWIAVDFKHQKMVDYLIKKGAKTDWVGEYGETLEELARRKKIHLVIPNS